MVEKGFGSGFGCSQQLPLPVKAAEHNKKLFSSSTVTEPQGDSYHLQKSKSKIL